LPLVPVDKAGDAVRKVCRHWQLVVGRVVCVRHQLAVVASNPVHYVVGSVPTGNRIRKDDSRDGEWPPKLFKATPDYKPPF